MFQTPVGHRMGYSCGIHVPGGATGVQSTYRKMSSSPFKKKTFQRGVRPNLRCVSSSAGAAGQQPGGPESELAGLPGWADVEWLAPLDRFAPDETETNAAGDSAADGGGVVDLDAPPPTANMNTIPLFPLGSQPYLPNSEQVLNIFEPRYRALYDNILMNGSRRFAVPLVRPVDDDILSGGGGLQLAVTCPVFYLETLKEVSEQTNDSVKYVCVHKVLDRRVKLKRVLNPSRWFDRSSYLVAEYEECEDTDDDVDTSEEEARVMALWNEVHSLQSKSEEEVRLAEGVVGSDVSMSRGGDMGSLWRSLSIWYELVTQRCSRKQSAMEARIQEILRNHFIGGGEGVPSSVAFADLPESVKTEIMRIQEEFKDEVPDEITNLVTSFSWMATHDSHAGRLGVFETVLESERKRLAARASLKALFEK